MGSNGTGGRRSSGGGSGALASFVPNIVSFDIDNSNAFYAETQFNIT